jgi:hypothetical protein
MPLVDDWVTWVSQLTLPAASLVALALLTALWALGVTRKMQSSRAVLAAIEAGVRGRTVPVRGPGSRGFLATVSPAPEPFREFSVRYRTLSILDPVDWIRRMGGARTAELHFWALLPNTPSSEIVWARGRVPDRALGHVPGRDLWIPHRLPLGGTEYIVRGGNTRALEHAFSDLHLRFGLVLRGVIVQREGAPQVELAVSGRRLDRREIPALIAGLRAIGRAALIG